VSLAAKCQNPLRETSGKTAVADKTEVCYDALCALALGVPRRKDQTPLEFIESFPRELDTLREEAYELTDIYVRSAYSQIKFDENILDRLRKFWWSFDQVRGKIVR
jgi:hypothetical protein